MALTRDLTRSKFKPPISLRLLMPLLRNSSVVVGAENLSISYIALNATSFIAVIRLILCASVCVHWKLMDKGVLGLSEIIKLVIN